MPLSQLNKLIRLDQTKQQKQPLTCRNSNLPMVTVDNAKLMQATHILVAIGSNHQTEIHLPFAKKQLIKLSIPNKIRFSTAYTNPDYTASHNNPKPDYTNFCAEIELDSPMIVADIINVLKSIEHCCLRHQHTVETNVESNVDKNNVENITKKTAKKPVTLDLDLLAVIITSDDDLDAFNSLDTWVVIRKRFPFKQHEEIGIRELGLLT